MTKFPKISKQQPLQFFTAWVQRSVGNIPKRISFKFSFAHFLQVLCLNINIANTQEGCILTTHNVEKA